MRPSKAEQRLRNLQTLLLIGAFFAAVLAALALGLVGVPQPIAIAAGPVVYLACWRVVLRAIRRRRRDATKDIDVR
jgi:hypothetical protein